MKKLLIVGVILLILSCSKEEDTNAPSANVVPPSKYQVGKDGMYFNVDSTINSADYCELTYGLTKIRNPHWINFKINGVLVDTTVAVDPPYLDLTPYVDTTLNDTLYEINQRFYSPGSISEMPGIFKFSKNRDTLKMVWQLNKGGIIGTQSFEYDYVKR